MDIFALFCGVALVSSAGQETIATFRPKSEHFLIAFQQRGRATVCEGCTNSMHYLLQRNIRNPELVLLPDDEGFTKKGKCLYGLLLCCSVSVALSISLTCSGSLDHSFVRKQWLDPCNAEPWRPRAEWWGASCHHPSLFKASLPSPTLHVNMNTKGDEEISRKFSQYLEKSLLGPSHC